MGNKTLNTDQQQFFEKNGYLMGLPRIFGNADLHVLNQGLAELLRLLRPGEDSKEIREWHESSLFLFDICMNSTILDCVEDLIGPDFYLWASNFFIKEPHSTHTVGWHQDAYYWPLSPHESLTVWIAFGDSDEQNGAMQVIPGSHRAGLLKHGRTTDTQSVLTLECETEQFRADTAVSLNLKAGEISIHDDKIVHGSPANPSDRPRVGLTARYSRTCVRCDLSINSHFKTYLCRGVDTYQFNPVGSTPTQMYGRLDRKHISVEEAGETAEEKLGLKT
jgi:hypothetical protein